MENLKINTECKPYIITIQYYFVFRTVICRRLHVKTMESFESTYDIYSKAMGQFESIM